LSAAAPLFRGLRTNSVNYAFARRAERRERAGYAGVV